jgi:hypothetical protein
MLEKGKTNKKTRIWSFLYSSVLSSSTGHSGLGSLNRLHSEISQYVLLQISKKNLNILFKF